MYDNAFNSIERELRNEDGIANELADVEQISWVQFVVHLETCQPSKKLSTGSKQTFMPSEQN